MKVSQLRELLADKPQDAEVIVDLGLPPFVQKLLTFEWDQTKDKVQDTLLARQEDPDSYAVLRQRIGYQTLGNDGIYNHAQPVSVSDYNPSLNAVALEL